MVVIGVAPHFQKKRKKVEHQLIHDQTIQGMKKEDNFEVKRKRGIIVYIRKRLYFKKTSFFLFCIGKFL